jgi:hypothetical protein
MPGETVPSKKRTRGLNGRRSPVGHSFRQAAILTGVPRGRIARAAKLGQIEVVEFGGETLLPDRTIRRINELYFADEPVE